MVATQLLVLDEPWSGLDAAARGVLGEIVSEVVDAGGTVVFTDHRESVTRAHAARTYAIKAGRITAVALGATFRQEPGGWVGHGAQISLGQPPDGGSSAGSTPAAFVALHEPPRQTRRHEVDWSGLPGVLGVTHSADDVLIRVAGQACDALLLRALHAGWSVGDVQRDATAPDARNGG
jgi:energy-coupling factor transporter ATP-binding protein EcfA2